MAMAVETKAVGVSSSVDPRVVEMYAKYAAGATLEEVGTQYAISRERVRQLFLGAGLKTRSREESGAPRRKSKTSPKAKKSRVGRHPDWARKRYSDEDLIACLRTASEELGGVLSTSAYTRFSRTRNFADGRPWPTHQTPANRFGSWRKALEAAGLRANPSSPIAGRRLFPVGHCVDAVRHIHRELGRIPSAHDYEQLARASGGALPSAATVRTRCGSWVNALRLAGFDAADGETPDHS